MKTSAISRADLLDALVNAGALGSVPVGLLGYERSALENQAPDDPRIQYIRGHFKGNSTATANATVVPAFPKPEPGQRLLQFLMPVESRTLQDDPLPPPPYKPLSDEELAQPKHTPSPTPPLVPWSRLAPFLRRRLGVMLPGRRLDQVLLSRQVAAGLPLLSLPRLSRQSWGHSACVLWDTSLEMEPYQPDVQQTIRRLKRERGRHGLKVISCHGLPAVIPALPPDVPVLVFSAMGQLSRDAEVSQSWAALGLHLTHAGHRLTVLAPCPRRRWLGAPTAFWPTAVWDRQPRFPRQIRTTTLEAEQVEPSAPHPSAELLLDLLSPATLITPALLRQVRLLLGAQADVGTEHEAWFHPSGTGPASIRYFSLLPGQEYEDRLARRRVLSEAPETRELVRQATAAIHEHHRLTCSPVITAEAQLRSYFTDSTQVAPPEDLLQLLERAVERLRELADTPGSRAGRASGLASWFMTFVEQRLSQDMCSDPDLGPLIAQGWVLARKFLDCLDTPWAGKVNAEAALAELRRHARSVGSVTSRHYRIGFVGAGLVSEPIQYRDSPTFFAAMDIKAGAPLMHLSLEHSGQTFPVVLSAETRKTHLELSRPVSCSLETDCERIVYKALQRPAWATRMWYDSCGVHASVQFSNQERHTFTWSLGADEDPWPELRGSPRHIVGFWQATSRPKWATAFGIDEYGLAAEFRIRDVPFVLRWIPPGSFLMGSPEDEPGRQENEGPQHRVTISKGFWMGETPITQAQWRAVVEAAGFRISQGFASKLNPAPSHYKGPSNLPVERVNWHDCTGFCRLLDALLPDGPGFHLPTEVQWEFACRAGAAPKPPFNGSILLEGDVLSPDLEDYAWYAGNSGKDCVVRNPQDSASWLGHEYGSPTAGPHPVKTKQPNSQGLHDVLGNVWEWCSDEWVPDAYLKRSNGVKEPRTDSTNDSIGRVVRGGSWGRKARICRAAIRFRFLPGDLWDDQGMRLAAGQHAPSAAEPHDTRSRARRTGG
jgi:formylglycine-generating enzyme required for sulfatase activity